MKKKKKDWNRKLRLRGGSAIDSAPSPPPPAGENRRVHMSRKMEDVEWRGERRVFPLVMEWTDWSIHRRRRHHQK